MSPYLRPNKGGRPKKITDPIATAQHFLSVKAREPEVTQKEFAQHYGYSDRSLRRCLKAFADEKNKNGPGLQLGIEEAAKPESPAQLEEPKNSGSRFMFCFT